MAKFIRNVFKNDTLHLYECNDGYVLYDDIIGYNIVIRAKTEQDAFVEALLTHQKYLKQLKLEHKTLKDKVDDFVCQFIVEDDPGFSFNS